MCEHKKSTAYCKSRAFGRKTRPRKTRAQARQLLSSLGRVQAACKLRGQCTVQIAATAFIGTMRHFCLVAVWVANLQQLCALQQQSTRAPALQQQSTRVPAVDQSRRRFFAQAAASSLVAAALPARAANETQPEFDAAAYFGIFSCEGWGQKRMPGSNTCMPK